MSNWVSRVLERCTKLLSRQKAELPIPDAVEASPAPEVVFLHVPKTGGITFRTILLQYFGDGFYFCKDPKLGALEKALTSYPCVELHTFTTAEDWYILHAELLRSERLDLLEGKQIFTMFRDPVEHYVSSFYYLHSIREHAEPAMRVQGIPFPESIEELVQHPASFNEQLAFMVGKSQRTGICVDRNDLEAAKEMLLRLKVHVGILERYDESMRVFDKVLGRVEGAGSYEIQNRNTARPAIGDLPPAVVERIRTMNVLDRELYEFGNALLDEELRRLELAATVRVAESGAPI